MGHRFPHRVLRIVLGFHGVLGFRVSAMDLEFRVWANFRDLGVFELQRARSWSC